MEERKNIKMCYIFGARFLSFLYIFIFLSFVQVIIKGLSVHYWITKVYMSTGKKVKRWKLYIILFYFVKVFFFHFLYIQKFLYIINRVQQWIFFSLLFNFFPTRFHKHNNFFHLYNIILFFLLNSHKSFNCYFVLFELIKYL